MPKIIMGEETGYSIKEIELEIRKELPNIKFDKTEEGQIKFDYYSYSYLIDLRGTSSIKDFEEFYPLKEGLEYIVEFIMGEKREIRKRNIQYYDGGAIDSNSTVNNILKEVNYFNKQ